MSIPAPTTDHNHVYGIVSPFGELWTWNTFEKAEEAEQHLRDFWGKDADEMLPQFSLCAVRVDVTPESEPFPLPSAQAIEAQRAATVKQGAVHESAVPEGNAPEGESS